MKFENWRAFPPFRRRRKRAYRTTTAKTPTPNMSVVLHREAGGVVGVRVVRRRRCSGALQVRTSPQRVRAVGGRKSLSPKGRTTWERSTPRLPRTGSWGLGVRPVGLITQIWDALSSVLPPPSLPLDLPNPDTTSPETAPP